MYNDDTVSGIYEGYIIHTLLLFVYNKNHSRYTVLQKYKWRKYYEKKTHKRGNAS